MSASPSVASAIVGSSEALRGFKRSLAQAAASDATVLLTGESGSGKGLAARTLHGLGPRAKGPLVVADLAALSPTLLESALFGHERGAFTDAHQGRRGLFRTAHRGSLVLDDVDRLPAEVQVKLLRVLQERVVEPLGAEESVPVDVRIVATTHADLRTEVGEGRFREDLYYRLAVVQLELPPLRARLEDLPELVAHLTARIVERLGLAEARPYATAALERLADHPWPGNVRELENALERVQVLRDGGSNGKPPDASPGAVQPGELAFLEEARSGMVDSLATEALRHGLTVDQVLRTMMERALEEQHGNVSAAARQVGLTRRAFDYRLARFEDETEGDGGEDGSA